MDAQPTPDLIRAPNTIRPIMTSDEIVGHVDKAMSQLPPEAHDALGQAHGLITSAPTSPAPFTDGIKPPRVSSLPSLPEPPALSGNAAPTMGIKAPTRIQGVGPSPAVAANTERLQHLQSNPSGVAGIRSPWARIPLQILDAVGGGLVPGIEQRLPGTEGHHEVLTRQAERAVTGDQNAVKAADESRLQNAQAGVQEALPELNETKVDLARTKQEGIDAHNRETEELGRVTEQGHRETAAATRRATLASHGYKEDEKGNIIALPYEEMSEPQKAVHDLKASQSEAAEATAALKKAQAENQPTLIALAQKRLASAQESHRIAAERLGLSEQQFEMRAYGTGAPAPGGPAHQPLPGTLQTDSGQAVGTAQAANVRPTATERGRADLAGSAQEQLQDMRAIVKAHPEFFGPGAGRASEFATWIGSEDPEAKRFATARSILADHAAGVFGARSEYASKAQEIAAGQYKDNPAAILTGLEQIEKAMKKIGNKGTMRTAGSDATADPKLKAYADQYFGGDIKKAQSAIDEQKKGKK